MTIQKGKGFTTMKKIEAIERVLDNYAAEKESGINHLLVKCYRNTQESGNEILDIDEIIWEHDYDELVRDLRRFGITEFTISTTFSGVFNAMEALIERGCTLEGMTRVYERFPSWMGGEHEQKPAMLMKVK